MTEAATAVLPLQEVLRTLRQVQPYVQQRYNTRLVGVFGSFARGEHKPDSDIDILVEFGKGSSLVTLGGVLNFLEDTLGTKVDVADEPFVRPAYKPFIYKDLIRL